MLKRLRYLGSCANTEKWRTMAVILVGEICLLTFRHRSTSILLPFRITRICPDWTSGSPMHLNVKVTVCAPKFASNLKNKTFIISIYWLLKVVAHSVEILTSGAFPTAFCTTKKSLVTTSITCAVWNTKSPFFLLKSLWNRHPVGSEVRLVASGLING